MNIATANAAERLGAVQRRIVAVDAARGAVMLFSCLAHFAWWIHASYPAQGDALAAIGMVATPAFLLISGAMVGMLCARNHRRGADLKSQFFNRGLFLLTVGHISIALTEAHLNGGLLRTIPGVTTVDEIGLSTLVVAFFVPQVAKPEVCRRLGLAAVFLLIATWLVNLYWLPGTNTELALEAAVIGGEVSSRAFATHAAVVQHFAIYLLGLPVGHFFAHAIDTQMPERRIARRFAASGIVLVGAALALHFSRPALDLVLPGSAAAVNATLRITQKIPPSPLYLLFYGGCALLVIAAMFHASGSARRASHAALAWVAAIGRASLAVFVAQYFLYWTVPDLIGLHPNRWALLFFAANVLLIRLLAEVWNSARGNRWLTFGIRLSQPV
jgi:uncharacterized membrane protein